MTVNQATSKGFILYETAYGWWATNGLVRVGPCSSMEKVLENLERELEAQDRPDAEDMDRLFQPVSINIVPKPSQLLLCVKGNHMVADGPGWNHKGWCPSCSKEVPGVHR